MGVAAIGGCAPCRRCRRGLPPGAARVLGVAISQRQSRTTPRSCLTKKCGQRAGGVAFTFDAEVRVFRTVHDRVPSIAVLALGIVALASWASSQPRPRVQAPGAPENRYAQVSAGRAHSCAVGGDQSVACWGDDMTRQSRAPAGRFVEVAAGGGHSCGLRDDGRVQCWGANEMGQSRVPKMVRFRQIAVGWHQSCGVTLENELRCWGGHPSGALDPPDGKFLQVSVGFLHSCAVRDDGAIICWGSNQQGQAAAPAFETHLHE